MVDSTHEVQFNAAAGSNSTEFDNGGESVHFYAVKPAALPPLPAKFRLSAEFQLLVAVSWQPPANLQAEQAAKIDKLITNGIDWQAFLALVDRHRVPALAHAALGRHATGHLPEEIRSQVKARSDQARREALQLAAETVRLAKAFNAAGIELLPLKGQLHSLELYGDPALRQARDIDIMIKPADLDQADRLLLAEGYRCELNLCALTPGQRRLFMAAQHHLVYANATTATEVEVHWTLTGLWTASETAVFWDLCQTKEVMGTTFLHPGDEAQLLMLCDHGAGHGWYRLKWLGDIARALSGEAPPDGDRLVALAERLDLERVLAQGALLAHWLYGVTLPSSLAVLIARTKPAPRLAAEAVDFMLLPEAEILSFSTMVQTKLLQLKLRSRPRYGKVLQSVFLSQGDTRALTLPTWLFWFYVPLRPLFWLQRKYRKPAG